MSPPSFPPSVPCSGAPFPPRGPLAAFPRFIGTTRHSDSLTTFPPGFVAFVGAVPPPPVFRSRGGRAPILRGPGLFTGFPNRPINVESSGPPRFLEDPLVCVPRSQTPARPQDLACCDPGMLPSATRTASALATIQFFRGSITRPTYSLSTLRGPGHPGTTQDSLPAGGLLCRAGFEPAGSLREVSALHRFLLTQALPGALESFDTVLESWGNRAAGPRRGPGRCLP